jgi:hypothetical protein
MLRRLFRDKSKASTRALCAVAEEDITSVGDLRADGDVFVVHAQGSELRRSNTS